MSVVKQIFHRIQSWWLNGYTFNRFLITYIGEKINIVKKTDLIKSVSLSAEQIRETEMFYAKNYGKKIPLHWHRLYQSYTGVYCKDYFPEILFSTKYEPLVNGFRPVAAQFGDKNLLHQLFGNVEGLVIPKTFYSCVNGIYRNESNQLITFQTMCQSIMNLRAVIKKTIDSSSGRDVQIVNVCDGVDTKTGKPISEIISEFGNNFVIQDIVKQHEFLERINPSSLNTFRVMSYIFNDRIYVCPIALRLGRNGSDRDNIHFGGLTIGVNEKDELREYAFSEFGEKFAEHPDTHVVFAGTKVPFVKALQDKAILLHSELPWLGIISWDLSINEMGSIVLIEANTVGESAWFPQMVNGEPLFGDNTAQILKSIGKK